ncbi:MAG: OadG family protein [Verrucomicrobiota bacterium]|nr:OadG family protein [Verrucomicrobiota bacterium]MEC8517602.1 OadG family protein [Verrucomicrobiota bacterium]MEC8753721.1 OadG family protein [Verrucomicrobiota bacterium]|tara:strand:- start:266 stop:475 length:210 start_codon:yes stop_codon:yes gene_type:complete
MSQGFTVMIIGMATVFAFLVLLIFSIKGISLYFVKNEHRFVDTNNTEIKKNDLNQNTAIAIAAIKAKRG